MMAKLLKLDMEFILIIGDLDMRLKLWSCLCHIIGRVKVSSWSSTYGSKTNHEFEGQEQKEVLVADTEPENVPSERVLAKAGFKRGPLVKGAFEVTDLVTGELVKKDATIWQYDRPKV